MSNTTCSNQNLNVKHVATLFEEVQNRYIKKLTTIDEKHINGDERHKQKLAIYESYVKDLSIQTRLLLQSLDELEREANQRVALLENKLKKAHASLQQHHSLSDVTKNVSSIEAEKWKLSHENLDLKHDLDSLTSFINTAKRTGKWDTKRLQLKTIPLDRIIGVTNEDTHTATSLHKEIQYRDERIQVLQAEVEQLRKTKNELARQAPNKPSTFSSFMADDEFKEQNNILAKKVEDLRAKLIEECQNTETFKMDLRLKANELKDLQEEFQQNKQRSDEHIHDLSTKLKTITDRHRDSTALLNNDIKTKKQQIEQYTQQIEQVLHEKAQLESDRSDLERQCRVKDSITADLEGQIRNLQRELTSNSYPTIPVQPIESTVPKIEYEKLDQELHSTKKRLDGVVAELKAKDALNNKLEQDLRASKKSHDEQLEQHIETTTNDVEQLDKEIRALKRLCEEKKDQLHKQSLELRACQEHLAVETSKNATNEHEHQKLSNIIQSTKEQIEKLEHHLKDSSVQNQQLEYTINELTSRNNLVETKLIETMTLIDLRNKTLMDYEQQMDKIKMELIQKHQEILDKQAHIEKLEEIIIEKSAEVSQLSETLETGLIKSHHREKYAEDNASKAQHDIKVLQRELRHVSEVLVQREHANSALNQQIQQLTNELKAKQDEFQQIQKSLNKQLASKQEQLVRYDQNLHEVEIKSKYAKEECLIQEKEITRLNNVQEEQENRLRLLQQDLLKLQQEKESINVQYERSEGDLHNIRILREDEGRKYRHEIEKLNSEISALKLSETGCLKNIDEFKENLFNITSERNDLREQNETYQNEIENIQKMLYDETESASKSSTKIVLLTRQLDEEQKRATDAVHQLDDLRMQLKSSLMTIDTLKSELSQTRLHAQEQAIKEVDFKQNLNRTNSMLEETNKSLDDRLREIETLNHLISRLQLDYEKSKNDLSIAHDHMVQLEIGNQTFKQHLTEKTTELSAITNRLHQVQQDFHSYEKEHRYSNEEYFEREQRMKTIENELLTKSSNYEKLQREHSALNEDLTKCRIDLEQSQKSDISHKEQLVQSTDEAQICKHKLGLLGNCFKTIVRKASETSERWANITSKLHEQVTDLSEDANKLRSLDERFEQSTKMLTLLRSQHEDLILQFMTVKPALEKAHLYVREYKRKWSQTSDENRHLRMETKRLRAKIDDFHRAEGIMHTKIDEQEMSLVQLRKELNNEVQNLSESQAVIERLKHSLNDTTNERDELIKNVANINKKIEKLDNDIDGYTDENRLLHQATQKLEKQLANAHAHIESLQRTYQQNELSYQEKINECESLIISLKDANRDALSVLEQKKSELNMAQTDIQSLKYEQSITTSKFENAEELNQELKRHISVIERSNDEHKRVLRKRDKELEQVKNDFEQNLKNATILNNKCTKQEAELNILHLENSSLSEELKLMRENVNRCEDEQRRLRKDCDQALNFIHDGIPELCLDEGIHDHNRNGALQEHLKKIPSLMQQLTGDRENLKTKNQLLLQFVHGLSYDLNDCQSGQKKYKLLKAHSKQQQLLLNQLESHVRFYESVFKEKGFFPTIEYASGSTVASAPDVIDKANSMCLPDRTNGSCEWKLFGWNPYRGCGYNQQMSSYLCIMKNLDGSKSTFLSKLNISTNHQYCLEFKYLTTGSITDGEEKLKHNSIAYFCFPKQQLELFWYSLTVQLPENLTMINVVTDTNGIASNHSLIIKDLSIQQCHRITTLQISSPMNTTILSSQLNRKKTFWIQYRWILIIGTLVVLFTSLIIIITINLYVSDRIFHQEPTITERIQITSMNLSQHFYEEPVSIILTPPIDISVYDHVRDNYRVDIRFSFKTKKSSFVTMSSIITDGDNHQKQDKYESIFKHYGFQMRAPHLDHQNEKNNIEINTDLNKYKRILHEIKTKFLQRNESNKKEKKSRTMASKTQQAISKRSSIKSNRKKDSEKEGAKQNRESVIKITLPDEAKARKTTYSKQQQKTNENQRISDTNSSLPITLSNSPSITTMKTAQKLPIVNSKSNQSISDIQSNRISTEPQSTNQIISSTLSFHQTQSGESNAKINAQKNKQDLSSTINNFESTWDIDEINKFTRDIFKRSSTKPIIRSHRIRLKCAEDSDDYLSKYSQRRTHCLDLFEEYVNGLKRPFGIIRDAASDPPVFDPGLTIMGPRVKKNASVIDKEEFQVIKRINSIEPRKKYALVHEQIGIFVIGGYNLFVNIPEQQEPDKDYLFKSDGSIVRISRLSPCRIHFGVYTNGDAIYVAGGQKINNELLDDIQRLNLRTLKWEYVATLLNPIAASATTVDEQRIYIAGGYDIFKNQTFFESTLTIYNMTTGQFENGNDLPSPRCRSLVFVVDNALFCVSGLIERRDHNGNKKIKISTDILKWTQEAPTWIKISQTPELSKLHALSFNDPYLEVTKRNLSDEHDTSEATAEAYYDFRTNLWANGSAPASAKTIPLTKQEHSSSAAKISDKSASRTTKDKKVTVAKTASKSNPLSKTKSTSKSKGFSVS
ncbi:unnamed protein product [Rotaria socialis]